MSDVSERLAYAIVTAARAFEENPLTVAKWGFFMRPRHVVYEVARHYLPHLTHRAILAALGAPSKWDADTFRSNHSTKVKALWWRRELIAAAKTAYAEKRVVDVSAIVIDETRGGARDGAGRPRTRGDLT